MAGPSAATQGIALAITAAAPPVTHVEPISGWRPYSRGGSLVFGRSLQVGQGDDILRVTAYREDALASRWRSECRAWPPRGVVVRLHGVQEAPLDRRLDRRLLDAGWMVVRYDSIPFGGLGFLPSDRGRAELAIDSPQAAAVLVDELLARIATAATAVLRHERFAIAAAFGPELGDLPVIVLGTSLGGILAPTTAAAVDEELRATGADGLAAIVLLAAGGDAGGICADSPAMDLDPSIVAPDTLAEWRTLMRGALDWSRLDPLHVAPTLHGVPTLMLHARLDAIVPARFGDRLWIALGRPDRYSYLAGHIGLLGLLTGEADEVMRWLGRRGLPVTPVVTAGGAMQPVPARSGPAAGTVPREGDRAGAAGAETEAGAAGTVPRERD